MLDCNRFEHECSLAKIYYQGDGTVMGIVTVVS